MAQQQNPKDDNELVEVETFVEALPGLADLHTEVAWALLQLAFVLSLGFGRICSQQYSLSPPKL